MSKYGEPWTIQVIVGDDRVTILPRVQSGSLHDAQKEISERIIACVNACAGIENPGALPALLARIEHALADDPNGRLAGIRGAFDVMMGDRT